MMQIGIVAKFWKLDPVTVLKWPITRFLDFQEWMFVTTDIQPKPKNNNEPQPGAGKVFWSPPKDSKE